MAQVINLGFSTPRTPQQSVQIC